MYWLVQAAVKRHVLGVNTFIWISRGLDLPTTLLMMGGQFVPSPSAALFTIPMIHSDFNFYSPASCHSTSHGRHRRPLSGKVGSRQDCRLRPCHTPATSGS